MSTSTTNTVVSRSSADSILDAGADLGACHRCARTYKHPLRQRPRRSSMAIKRIVHRWPFLSFFFSSFLKILHPFLLFFLFFLPFICFLPLCDSACLALEIDRICLISLPRVMSLDDRKYCMLFGDSFLQFSPTRNSCHLHGWNVL